MVRSALAVSIAGATICNCMTDGDMNGAPPGSLWPLVSHGFTGLGFAAMNARAFASASAPSSARSTSPCAAASCGAICLPSASIGSAPCRPSMRTMRTTPPAPGSSPSCTSGRPSLVRGSFTAMRAWQASASSNPPPRAAPSISATTGLPSFSIRRSCALIVSTSSKIASGGCCCALAKAVMSPPAKNDFLAERRIAPLMSSCASRSSVAANDGTKPASIRLT